MVLALRRDAVTASVAPIARALQHMEARLGDGPTHGIAPGVLAAGVPALDATGWVRATELVDGGPHLDALLDAAKQRWRAQPHAAAALAWKAYTYWLVLPPLLGYATSRRVPLPRASDVLVRYSEHQPFLAMALDRPRVAVLADDPLAASHDPQVVVCRDDADLLTELRRSLVDEHLEPLIEQVQHRARVGRRTLWGSLASGVAYALARAAGSVPEPVPGTIAQVLTAFDVDDLVDVSTDPATGGVSVQRRTCCLAFTLPEPKVCSGCCIR